MKLIHKLYKGKPGRNYLQQKCHPDSKAGLWSRFQEWWDFHFEPIRWVKNIYINLEYKFKCKFIWKKK